jgi:spore photoproduct lyase
MNAPSIVAADERGTASLAQRVAAARRTQDAGYLLGFHFDPLVEFDGWEAEYRSAIDAVAASVDVKRIAWVSLGSLRLTPRLEQIIRERGTAGRVLASERVPGTDGKSRVWRGLRERMYRMLAGHWRAVAPAVPIYLCMEPPAVWERVMGETPSDRDLALRLTARTAW